MIPARYNEETTLGIEVYSRRRGRKVGGKDEDAPIFRLTSKAK